MTAMARYSSGNTPPFGHWNSLPIYLGTILSGALIVGLVVSAVLMATHSLLLPLLVFEMPLNPAWSLWRLFTYVFVSQVSFFSPFSILFFYWMSVGIETHLGRVPLAKLLILLALAVPAVAAVWWMLFPGEPEMFRMLSNTFQNGQYLFMSGLLVAFATLYPNTEAWGWVPFKWVAFACIVCGSLMLLAQNAWLNLSELWCSCAVAFAYVRYALEQEYDDSTSPFSRIQNWFQRRKFRVVRAGDPPSRRSVAGGGSESEEEMDVLLDKIARSGISSLTAGERARLEKARAELLKRERR